MKNNSIRTMLLGMLLMFFGAAVVATRSTLSWEPGVRKDAVLAVGGIVFLAGFVTGVVGFFRKDA
jgi:hypothetical protein